MNVHVKSKPALRPDDVRRLFNPESFTIIPLHTPFATSTRKGKTRADGKRPLHGRWQTKPYDSKKVIRKFGGKNNLGIRLTASQLVIDVDPRHDGERGLRKLKKFLGDDLSDFPTVITGSGGLHIFMAKPDDMPVLDSVEQFPGVEFKSAGRQVVAVGSIHPGTGKPYRHDDLGPDFATLPRAPKALLKAIKRPPPPEHQAEGGDVAPDALETMLAVLDPENYSDNDSWFPLMAACHHATGGDGREEFIAWSTSDPAYADDGYMIGRRWDSLSASREGALYTKGTLFKALADAGHADLIPADDAADTFSGIDEESESEAPSKPKEKGRLTFLNADEIQPENTKWLWQDVFGCGMINLIAGKPGQGKSQVTCNIAASVTTGGKWPDGSRAPKGTILILSAEDKPSTSIVPRLMAAGADLAKCVIMKSSLKPAKKGARLEYFNFADHAQDLSLAVKKFPDLVAIIIDPVSAYMGGKTKGDSHKNADVRSILTPLSEWAMTTGVAVIIVTHLNKSGQGSAMSQVTDSQAFTALARANWIVVPEIRMELDEPTDTGRKLFLRLKVNDGEDANGYAYTIHTRHLKGAAADGSDIKTSRIEWCEGREYTTADAAISQHKKKTSETDKAEQFLESELANGPVLQDTIKKRAEELGFSFTGAVRRAKRNLGVKARKQDGVKDGHWEWFIPDEFDGVEEQSSDDL